MHLLSSCAARLSSINVIRESAFNLASASYNDSSLFNAQNGWAGGLYAMHRIPVLAEDVEAKEAASRKANVMCTESLPPHAEKPAAAYSDQKAAGSTG